MKTDWWAHVNPDVYFVDGTHYESLMTYFSTQSTSGLMLQAVSDGRKRRPSMAHTDRLGIGQEMSIHVGFSRDGFHIQRPVPRIPIVRTDWKTNRVYVMGAQVSLTAFKRQFNCSLTLFCLLMGSVAWLRRASWW